MGITLGPMPFDAVAELAETSAIMRDDRVREGASKQWKLAHEVPGLFGDGRSLGSDSGVVSLSDFEVTETSPVAGTQVPAKPKAVTATPEAINGIVRLGGFEVRPGESEATAETTNEPASALLGVAARLETADPEVVRRKKVERVSKKESARREVAEPDSNLGSPDAGIPQLDIPAETPQRELLAPAPSPLTVDSRDRSLVATESETVQADTREARPVFDLTALVDEGVEDGIAPTPQAAITTPPALNPTIQPWQPPVKRNRQLVVRSCLTLAAVVAVCLLFSLLKPDMEVATYDQYAAIYLEYRSLAESPGTGSWSEFATRAKTELDETLPDLEASAVPGERSKSLLLYAGRDLRTALDLTPGVTYPHAERLAGFFQQLNELHASSE